MSQVPDAGTAGAKVASSKATETLSQFLARILQQLAISAWLPAAALVGLTAFVLRLGSVLDEPSRGAAEAVGAAFTALAGVKVGGALLLVGAVVVATTLTQAFSFEAIRVLEGYWGTSRLAEAVARWRCGRFRRRLSRLEKRSTALTTAAADVAARNITDEQKNQLYATGEAELTKPMVEALVASLTGEKAPNLPLDAQKKIRSFPWRQYSDPELLRRRVNVETRLRDFPDSHRIQPTRLGNVLRRFEDETGWRNVESGVQELFDDLPFSLQFDHDEQRARLDLYCSMVSVVGVATAIAVARLTSRHPSYAVGAVAVGLAGMWLMYRAGVASARAYGALLVVIARWDEERIQVAATETRAVALKSHLAGTVDTSCWQRWRWRCFRMRAAAMQSAPLPPAVSGQRGSPPSRRWGDPYIPVAAGPTTAVRSGTPRAGTATSGHAGRRRAPDGPSPGQYAPHDLS